MMQYARVQITSSAIGFFRSSVRCITLRSVFVLFSCCVWFSLQIISLISGGYAKKAPRGREYHRERMIEEFGAPEGWSEAED